MATEPRPALSLPIKIKVQLWLLGFFTDRAFRRDGTINRRLMNFIDLRTPANSTPKNGVKSHDVVVDPSRNLWFRLFLPSTTTASQGGSNSSSTLPVIVFFHGGGFAFLNPASKPYDAVCRRFVRRFNAVVISVNYRLTPEHKFPSQYDDGFDVLKFIDDNRKSIEFWPENADVRKCFLAGDSAGGNLAHNLAVRVFQQEKEGKLRDVKLIGLIVIQPFWGGKEKAESEIRLEGAPIVSLARTEWLWKAFLPYGSDPDHWAVNVCGPNALDVSGLDLPPVLLFVGGFDPLRDWQLRYGEWLKRSGKDVVVFDYPTVPHAFYIFPDFPESLQLITEVKRFLDKQCSKIH
ncbi:hypothetical protein Dimus_011959 [Dionaea muscipula]